MKDETLEIRREIVGKWLPSTCEFIDTIARHSGLNSEDTHKLAMEMAGTLLAQVHAIGTYGQSIKSRKHDLESYFKEISVAYDKISEDVDESISIGMNKERELRREIG